MTVGERVMRRLVDRVGLDDDARTDLLDDAIRLGRERGRCGTVAEIASIASTAIELRARRATDGRAATFVRQGLWFGGALAAWAGLASLGPNVFAAGVERVTAVAMCALAVSLAVSLVAITGRARGLDVVARAGAGIAASVSWWAVHLDRLSAPDAALVSTAALALLVGERPLRVGRTRSVPATAVADTTDAGLGVGPATGLAIGSTAGLTVSVAGGLTVGLAGLTTMTSIAAPAVTLALITIVVPVGLLAAASADPRLGVAAAVALFWRFAATDPAGLAAIVAAVRAGESTLGPVIRWMVMGAAFLVAAGLTRRHLRLVTTR